MKSREFALSLSIAAVLLIFLASTVGISFASYPGPDTDLQESNIQSDYRAFLYAEAQGIYGSSPNYYQDCYMWAQTENTQPASLNDLMVWFHANNWDSGLYHAGSYAAGGPGYGVNSVWLATDTAAIYSVWFLWWKIDEFTIQASAYVHV